MTKNKKKMKGFTLVELLVVIAIIAILATVSVVGYTSFTKKAKDSNAVTELSAIKTDIIGELMDGEVTEGTTSYTLDTTTGKITIKNTGSSDNITLGLAELKKAFSDLEDVNSSAVIAFYDASYSSSATKVETVSANGSVTIVAITYTKDGGNAVWDLTTGDVTAIDD